MSPAGLALVAEMLANHAIDFDAIWERVRQEPSWHAAHPEDQRHDREETD